MQPNACSATPQDHGFVIPGSSSLSDKTKLKEGSVSVEWDIDMKSTNQL